MKRLIGPLLAFGLFFFGSTLNAAETRTSVPSHVGSETCFACHPAVANAWKDSHHALAWNKPDKNSVLGDFSDMTFAHKGVVSRFSNFGGKFFVTTAGADGRQRKFEVVGTVGVTPLQQYLVETEPGRLQVLDVAWDTAQRRWYHLYPDQNVQHGNGLHWTGPYKTWNARCAECHATGYEKRYAPLTRRYTSTQAETGVGCEACHGPGSAHVAWARDSKSFDRTAWNGVNAAGIAIEFNKKNSKAELQLCAGCHSRREPLGDSSPVPGTPFHDSYRLAKLRAGLYHSDGQILDEVYVYGSFLQSKMYDRGVRCTDCHEPHSALLKTVGNAVCTQCHGPSGNPEFPTLKKAEYDTPAHHFHVAGTNAAKCKSCHMIERVYMGIDGRRDHSFRVPRPDLSVALGTPNACTDCHKDKSSAWAVAELANQFPNSSGSGAHYATPFTAARQGTGGSETAKALVEIALSTKHTGIVRATSLDLLQTYANREIARQTAGLLRDPDPLVRAAAIPLQRAARLEVRARRMSESLQDERRSVRIEAARAILDIIAARASPKLVQSARPAVREYQASLAAKADFPETQMAIAGTALVLRNYQAAERAFAQAVRMDPQRVEAWRMIARLRAAQNDFDGALKALLDGLKSNPDNSVLTQMLRDVRRSGARK